MLTAPRAALLLAALLACASCDPPRTAAAETEADAGPAPNPFELLVQRAEAGEAAAAYDLGAIYTRGGLGARIDPAESARWFTRAADAGHALAQYELAILLIQGEGVEQDISRGVDYLRKAADQGHVNAQGNLGVVYSRGAGAPRDAALAAHYFQLAADQGEATSMYNLARAYQFGRGVKEDLARAAQLYEQAASRNMHGALRDLGVLYLFGRGVPQDFDMARQLFERADSRGIEVRHLLARLYQEGQGVRADPERAFALLTEAAWEGSADAQLSLAFAYYNGEGTQVDRVQARKWMIIASRSGEARVVEVAQDALAAQRNLFPDQFAQAEAEANAWLARNPPPARDTSTSPFATLDP